MNNLTSKTCKPCEVGTPALAADQVSTLAEQLNSEWNIVDAKKISREFKFKNFVEAMAFVNKVAEIAEREGHHPDLHIFYNKVTVEFWTHAINGLSENDFIVAAKVDAIN